MSKEASNDTKEADVYYLVEKDKAKRVGYHEYLISCPYHEETTPSCLVNECSKTFYCFSCAGAGTLDIWDVTR